MSDIVLARWRHVATDDAPHVVLPDGCRDLICREAADGTRHWSVSPLMNTATVVPGVRGMRLVGLRLRAGVLIDEAALLAGVRESCATHGGPVEVDDVIEACCSGGGEAVTALASRRPVGDCARDLGVGIRTLERHVLATTGRPPRWWRGLARARHAAAQLDAASSLATLAAAAGYADQSHLCREFVRWFGLPPTALRRRADLVEQLTAAGYGDGASIGVQSSTSAPESSRT